MHVNFVLTEFSEVRLPPTRIRFCFYRGKRPGKTLRASTNRPLAGSTFGSHDRLRACQTNATSTTRTPVSAEYASTLLSSGPSTAGTSNPLTR